ncbi:MAG: hypothetical protein AAF467_17005 [Actinomycetota bacterium]
MTDCTNAALEPLGALVNQFGAWPMRGGTATPLAVSVEHHLGGLGETGGVSATAFTVA